MKKYCALKSERFFMSLVDLVSHFVEREAIHLNFEILSLLFVEPL